VTRTSLATSVTVDVAIKIGLLGLLVYWSLKVIGPFLTVALWSVVLTVGLYPLFDWLTRRLRSRRLAATVITLLCLMIVVGPVAWLGLKLIDEVELVVGKLDSKLLSIPLPAETVKGWPLIGEQVYDLWTRVATDTKAILVEVAPRLKPLGGQLLELAQSVVFGLLEFVASHTAWVARRRPLYA